MLYEMTTGDHPFQRETAVQTLSAIIADDPPDPAQVTPPLPVGGAMADSRLLAKNPRERLRAHRGSRCRACARSRRAISPKPRQAWHRRFRCTASRTWTLRVAAAAAFAACRPRSAAGPLSPVEPPSQLRAIHAVRDRRRLSGHAGVVARRQDGSPTRPRSTVLCRSSPSARGTLMRTQVTNLSTFDCYAPVWSADGRHIYYHSLARATAMRCGG